MDSPDVAGTPCNRKGDKVTQNAGTRPRASGWVGWIAFAAAMLLVIGVLNLINGFAAVFQDEIFVSGDRGALILDVTAWGWIHVVFGLVLVGVGIGLIQGQLWAAITATFLVMLNMITQMFMLPAYPFWSILLIVLDAFVLYALTVHGDERIRDL